MSDFKTRLLEEKEELAHKINKLELFFDGNESIDSVQISFLGIQYLAMKTYKKCLEERIKRL